MASAISQGVWTAAGREGSLDDLFRLHYAAAVRIAAAVLRDRAEAEDVVQDVFVSLSARLARVAEPEAWIRRAVLNASLNRLRSLGRRRRHESRAAGSAAGGPSAEALTAERESAAELRQALAALPRRQAMVLVLRHSGFTYEEVGRATGIPTNQIGTLLRRAEMKLREAMHRDPS